MLSQWSYLCNYTSHIKNVFRYNIKCIRSVYTFFSRLISKCLYANIVEIVSEKIMQRHFFGCFCWQCNYKICMRVYVNIFFKKKILFIVFYGQTSGLKRIHMRDAGRIYFGVCDMMTKREMNDMHHKLIIHRTVKTIKMALIK